MTNLHHPRAAPDGARILELAREVLGIESAAVAALASRLGDAFLAAVDSIFASTGRVVVTGMGKSGHVGGKIASTLASTGTPAFFMHPGEASHGDLGMIAAGDVVIAISNSGESDEILRILPLIKRRGAKIIAITGRPRSTLATEADVHLDAAVEKEACPMNLAPTASTTAVLALGDALAVALLEKRGFGESDYAMHHPGGALGRKLLLHVSDLMHTGDRLPRVGVGATLKEAILEMSQKGLGMTAIVDGEGRVAGLFTDGDLRRALERHEDIRGLKVADVMTRNPRSIGPSRLAAEAAQVMQAHHVSGRLLVVDDDGRLVGAIHVDDLLRAGVI
ncbi:MAG TPA: KpsF/GutQ family sugar-phosphate isomerase [Usitatibacteraceae bacterium]|nr:KpsF/GutQ family sugar-phosphate isomerase [Usitatibacteraceae bacterium]